MDIEVMLDEGATMPRKEHSNDAGFDLFAVGDYAIPPGQMVSVRTGVRMAIPGGYYGQVASRSGLAFKHGIVTLAGVIDAGYRDEIRVLMMNLNLLSNRIFEVKHGSKIAQIIILPLCERDEMVIVESLPSSARGTKGFGSSG